MLYCTLYDFGKTSEAGVGKRYKIFAQGKAVETFFKLTLTGGGGGGEGSIKLTRTRFLTQCVKINRVFDE